MLGSTGGELSGDSEFGGLQEKGASGTLRVLKS